MVLSVLGLGNALLTFDQILTAWSKLTALKTLSYGLRINLKLHNFINWSSNLDPILACHLTGS
jgi:hypothetical protein